MIPIVLVAVVGALGAWPSGARAQSVCDDDAGLPRDFGDLLDVFPSAGNAGVPTDGFVRVRYRGRVPAPQTLAVTDATGATVTGTSTVVGSELLWQSDTPLRPLTRYSIVAPTLGGAPLDGTSAFTTGVVRSIAGPGSFRGVRSISFTRSRERDLCGDPDAVTVTAGWDLAGTEAGQSNNWPANDVEYVVFETRGPGIGGPVERARERGRLIGSCDGGAQQCVSFRLPSSAVTAQTCFVVQAFDAYGNTAAAQADTCIDPEVGGYFAGCSVRRPVRSPRGVSWFAAVAVITLASLVLRLRSRTRG